MPRLPLEPRKGTATLHQHPPLALRFAPLLGEAAHGNAVAIDERDASRTFRERLTSWKVFGKRHPGAPPPDNRSTHQRYGAGRALRIPLRAGAARVRLS